jgi:hypothetical protein
MLTYKEYFEEISFMNKLEDAVKAGLSLNYFQKSNSNFIPFYTGLRPELPAPIIIPEYCELLRRCWDQDPVLRPPFEDIMRTLSTIHVDGIEDEPASQFVTFENLRRLAEVEIALCIWDFISIATDELTLQVGDLVEVLVREGDWTR